MVTKSDYAEAEVQAALSVIVELMTILGEYRDHVVLVGGWVPYFLVEAGKTRHTGSTDIDLALDMKNIPSEAYSTILELLRERGYEQSDKQPFIFYRSVTIESGRKLLVEVDLLAGEYGGTGRSHRTQQVQDVRPRKARGCDLAFDDPLVVAVRTRMPNGAVSEVSVRIAAAVPFFVMKGMVLDSRLKEKDAYDIYFTLLNYDGGIEALVEFFRPHLSNRLVLEGLSKIRNKFSEVDALGPVAVADFMEITDADEREMIKRDAFEIVAPGGSGEADSKGHPTSKGLSTPKRSPKRRGGK